MAHEEYRIHVAIVKHIQDCFPQVGFFHPTNEQKDAKSAFFGKQMGVKPGVADIIAGWSKESYGGTGVGVLEIKASEGRLSNSQNRFLSWADSIGWSTGVAKSVRGAHQVLCSWGLQPKYHGVSEPDLRTDEQKKKDAFDLYAPRPKPPL